MNTSTPKFAITSNQLACASTVLRAKNEILSALKVQAKVILLTGEAGKGKSTLLRSIANEISHNHRLIFFDGNDSASSSNDEYKFVKNFICESSQLDERIVIIIDAVELVPEQTLTQFLSAVTANGLKNNNLSVLLSGLPTCKNMLDEKLATLKLPASHSTLDNIGEEELRFLTAKKDYQIKPNKDEYSFDANAIKKLSNYVNNDLKLADVALEWCIAIANYSDSDILSSTVIDDAIECIQKFSEDHNIKPSNAYPVVKDVNHYLENHIYPLDKEDKQDDVNINIERNRPFISKTKFETIDLNERVIPKLDFETDVELDLENETTSDTEVIPQEWITTTKKLEPQRKAAYITAFTLCALIIISFVAIENKPFLDTAFNKIEELNDQTAFYDPDPMPNAVITDDINTNAGISGEVEQLDTTDTDEPIAQIDNVKAEIKPQNQPVIQLDKVYGSNAEQINSSTTTKIEKLEQEDAGTPVILTETLTETNDVEIDALLDLATQQFDAKQLTTPPGDNALETYQKILTLKPGYELAQQGVENIHARYLNWANYYLKLNETDRSRYFYEKAYEIDPNDLASKQMADNLKQEISQTNINTSSPFNIDGLLTKARQQFRDKQLTTPANNNAYETYREVLKVEPENAAAILGISQIKKSYINWAETDVKQNELRRAALFYRKALEIDPQDTKIARRLDEITNLNTANN